MPQECTRDTKGLLYFDLLSSKMYRCSGRSWEAWGWGTGDGFQYTALLKDASSSSADDDDQPPSSNVEVADEVAERQPAKNRRRDCSQGN